MSPKIEAVLNTIEPRFRKIIMAALEGLRDRAVVDQIARLLTAGDVDGVVRLLSLSDEAVASIHAVLTDAVQRGAAGALPASIDFAFDVLNPLTVEFLRSYRMNLIREIDQTTRAGVESIIMDGFSQGQGPRQIATAVKARVGLTQSQAKAVSNFRRELATFHLRRSAGDWNLGGKISRAPGGAQVFVIDEDGNPVDRIKARRLRDLRFDGTLRRAIHTGKPLTQDQIDRMVAAYERKFLRFRATNIARTEALRAANAGEHQHWLQAVYQGVVPDAQVRRFWLTAQDERVRLDHRVIPMMNREGVGVRVPFATPNGPVMLPPAGVNCRCTVAYRLLHSGPES